MAKRKIFTKSIKHYVAYTNASTASAGIRTTELVSAVAEGATRSATSTIWEGSHVQTIFIEYWLVSTHASNTTQFVVALILLPSGTDPPTASEMLNLGAYANKKNILYVTQGVLGPVGTQAVPVMREWHLIPTGKTRMGITDKVVICLAPVGTAIQNCGISTYKEKS